MTLAKSINLSIPQVDLSKLRIIYPCLLGSEACGLKGLMGESLANVQSTGYQSLRLVVIGNL